MVKYITSSIFLSLLIIEHAGFAMELLPLLQQDKQQEDALLCKKVGSFDVNSSDVFVPDDVQRVIASCMMQDFLCDTAKQVCQNQPVGDSSYGKLQLAEISHNDKWLITVHEAKKNTAYMWSMATAQLLDTFEHDTDVISCLKISSDDTYVVTGSKNGTTIAWHVATGRPEWTFGKSGAVKSIAIDPDNKYLVTCSVFSNLDKVVQIWDMQTGYLVCILDNEEDHCISSLLIAGKHEQLVTGSCGAMFKLWDMKTGKLVHKITDRYSIPSSLDMVMAFDDKYLLFSHDKNTRVWDMDASTSWIAFGTRETLVESLFVSLDKAKLLVLALDGCIEGYDMSGRLLHVHSFGDLGIPKRPYAFDGCGKKFLKASPAHAVEAYDVETGFELYCLKGHTDNIDILKVNSDGTQVVTGSCDNTARIWSLKKSSARVWLENEVLPFQANLIARAYVANKETQKFEIAFGTDDMMIWVSLPSHVRDYLNLYLNVVLIPQREQTHQ